MKITIVLCYECGKPITIFDELFTLDGINYCHWSCFNGGK